jgi:cupin superfamily acireductone dioxygenase involved in methionine salvage
MPPPYASQAQAGYFHTHKKELEKQGVSVEHWDRATKGKKLPVKVKKKPHKVKELNAMLDSIIHG